MTNREWKLLLLLCAWFCCAGVMITTLLLVGIGDIRPVAGWIEAHLLNQGDMESAAGFWAQTTTGRFTFLISRDGYLSVSSGEPDWKEFMHISTDTNLLQLAPGDETQPAVLYINGERAWQGTVGSITGCGTATERGAAVIWIAEPACAQDSEYANAG